MKSLHTAMFKQQHPERTGGGGMGGGGVCEENGGKKLNWIVQINHH